MLDIENWDPRLSVHIIRQAGSEWTLAQYGDWILECNALQLSGDCSDHRTRKERNQPHLIKCRQDLEEREQHQCGDLEKPQ